jgi:hypothetical protein
MKIKTRFLFLSLAAVFCIGSASLVSAQQELFKAPTAKGEMTAVQKTEPAAPAAVFIYVNDLEKSSCFKNVKTKYTSKRKDQDREIVDFEVLCALEGPAEVPS